MLRCSLRILRYSRRLYCNQKIVPVDDPAIDEYIKTLQEKLNQDHLKEFSNVRNQELKNIFNEKEALLENIEQLNELLNAGTESKDKEMCKAAEEEMSTCLAAIRNINDRVIDTILSPEINNSTSGCIMEILPGVGGKEAMLFAGELTRMYEMFCLRKGWTVETLEESFDDESGGMRRGVLSVEGSGVKEILRYEGGVHRVQRIPATERSGRLHTSTVTVAILTQPTQIEVQILDKDLRIETKRATGAGGQHVNTTDSAVRITHIPTGTSVDCQTEREQHKNKRKAMIRLRTILYQKQLEKKESEEKAERKSQVGQANRNEKIRTYNFNQDRVTDHRLGSSSGSVFNIDNLMNGGQVLENLMEKVRVSIHRSRILEDIEYFRRKKT